MGIFGIALGTVLLPEMSTRLAKGDKTGADDAQNRSAALGLFFHFLIATTAAAVYYLASRQLRLLVNHLFISGPLYGIGVYLFMNFVVLPLSAIGSRGTIPPLPALIGGLLIHMFGIGLVIALVVRRYSR